MDSDSSLDGEFETKQEIAVQSRRDSTTHQYDSSGEEGEGEDEIESNQDVVSNRDNTSDHEDASNQDNLSSHIDLSNHGPSSLHGDLSNIDETSNQENASGVTISDMSFQDKVIHHEEMSNHSLDRDNLSRREGLVKSPVSVESNDDGELSDSSHDSEGNSHISSVLSVKSVTGRKDDDEDDDDGELLEEGEHVEEMSTSHRDGAVNATRQNAIAGHGTDLSDVSDLDSNDGRDSIGCVSDEGKRKKSGSSKPPLAPAVEVEQLDFEAEEQQDKEEREEGECDRKSEDEGEIKGEDLEEGEVTDDEENRPEETEPRPICRFYNRGQCTWGSSCRFLHPGVTDKGNYTMFDMVRPLVPVNGPPLYPPMEYRIPYEKPLPVGAPYQGVRKEETPVFESAWERGLRQAKELMRKSTKRKETDMDFEEKKMNLSLGQEELDKENDYYTRPASPVVKDDSERWSSYDRLKGGDAEPKYARENSVLGDRYDDFGAESPYYHHPVRDYWPPRRVHYEPGDSRPIRVEAEYVGNRTGKYQRQHRTSPAEYYEKVEKKKKSQPTREVIVQRVEKPWRDESRYTEVSTTSHKGRGDEWADPWMRSKSPTGRKSGGRPTRKQSYSTGSSYSSSSSSRSSSQSSYSSYSRDSRSRSHSKSFSRSGSRSRSRSRTPQPRRPRRPTRSLVPTTELTTPSYRANKKIPDTRLLGKGNKALPTSLILSEKKAANERALLMNPPAPSPRKKEVRPLSPGMMRKSAQNPPPPPHKNTSAKAIVDRPKITVAGAASIKAKMHSHSMSSRSSSASETSGSSSDSSESSYSSSSSSREPSPKAVRPPKRMPVIHMDERERLALAQSMKIKAMDALKLSGQKQQIKLTLKTPGLASVGPNSIPGVKKPTTGLPELPELNLVRRERAVSTTLAGKKRSAEEAPASDQIIAAKVAALSKPTAKKATSRREELLKQLKAVEDAIARKRSKI